MNKLSKVLSVSAVLLLLTGCGAPDDNASEVSSVAAPNLKVSAPNFKCGQGVVVLKVENVGNADAKSSFLRIEQSNAPSQGPGIAAIKAGESRSIGITVKYKNGNLDAKITADATKNVAESNELDNELRLTCRG